MPRTDDTPPNAHRRSGEWPEWAAILHDQGTRVEKSVARLTADLADHVGDDKALAVKVDEVRSWKEQTERDSRQGSLGVKLAIVGAIASPVAIILFESLKH